MQIGESFKDIYCYGGTHHEFETRSDFQEFVQAAEWRVLHKRHHVDVSCAPSYQLNLNAEM